MMKLPYHLLSKNCKMAIFFFSVFHGKENHMVKLRYPFFSI